MGHGSFVCFVVLFVFAQFCFSDDKCHTHVNTPTIFNEGTIVDIVWGKTGPSEYGVALLTLSDQTLYRSADSGKTWTKVPNVHVKQIIRTASDNKFYFVDVKGNLAVTTDQGKTVQPRLNFSASSLQPHPTKEDWALATHESNLFFTRDLGQNWEKLFEKVSKASWGQAGKGAPETSFHLLWKNETSALDYTYCRSVDLGKTLLRVKEHCVDLVETSNELFIVAQKPVNTSKQVTLWLGNATSMEIRQAVFPFTKGVQQNGYWLTETGESNFLTVDLSDDQLWGHAYVPESLEDPHFTLSLKYISGTFGAPKANIFPVGGVDGIYIANKWVVGDESATRVAFGTPLQTYITFNAGAAWSRLTVPQGVKCTDCNLNFIPANFYSDTSSSFLTSGRGVGLVMGSGTVKTSAASPSPADVGVFFSRDAGQTWQLVKNGTSYYHFLDHGSVIFLVDHERSVNNYLYTWNEGISWHNCSFPSVVSVVKGVKSSPSPTSLSLLLVGETSFRKGMIMHIDFSDLHNTVCGDHDYEEFSPHSNLCMLGQKFTYKRKIPGRECFNGENEIRSTPVPCACTYEDYKCDYCFERAPDGKKCIWSKNEVCQTLQQSVIDAPSKCSSDQKTYKEITGYRLSLRNKCNPTADGAVNLLAPTKDCPSDQTSKTALVVGIVVGVVVLAISLGAVLYLRKKNAAFKERMDTAFQKVCSCCSSKRHADSGHVNLNDDDEDMQ